MSLPLVADVLLLKGPTAATVDAGNDVIGGAKLVPVFASAGAPHAAPPKSAYVRRPVTLLEKLLPLRSVPAEQVMP